jgi:hypothetical protein
MLEKKEYAKSWSPGKSQKERNIDEYNTNDSQFSSDVQLQTLKLIKDIQFKMEHSSFNLEKLSEENFKKLSNEIVSLWLKNIEFFNRAVKTNKDQFQKFTEDTKLLRTANAVLKTKLETSNEAVKANNVQIEKLEKENSELNIDLKNSNKKIDNWMYEFKKRANDFLTKFKIKWSELSNKNIQLKIKVKKSRTRIV